MIKELLKTILCLELAKKFGMEKPTKEDLENLEHVWELINLRSKDLGFHPTEIKYLPSGLIAIYWAEGADVKGVNIFGIQTSENQLRHFKFSRSQRSRTSPNLL